MMRELRSTQKDKMPTYTRTNENEQSQIQNVFHCSMSTYTHRLWCPLLGILFLPDAFWAGKMRLFNALPNFTSQLAVGALTLKMRRWRRSSFKEWGGKSAVRLGGRLSLDLPLVSLIRMTIAIPHAYHLTQCPDHRLSIPCLHTAKAHMEMAKILPWKLLS